MSFTDTERALRDWLRKDAGEAADSFDAGLQLYRWQNLLTARRAARRRIAAVAAAAAMLLVAVSVAGVWLERRTVGPALPPTPSPTLVARLAPGPIVIQANEQQADEHGDFTLSRAGSVIDRGTSRFNDEVTGRVETLAGGLGRLVIRWGVESLTSPPADRIGTRYAWTLVSSTGAYAGMQGVGVATELTGPLAAVVTWELTGALSRSDSTQPAHISPGDVLISAQVYGRSPSASGSFALTSATGVTDLGTVRTTATHQLRDGSTRVFRRCDGQLGSFDLVLTFRAADPTGAITEHWTVSGQTGGYAGLIGSGGGTFLVQPPYHQVSFEDLRGALTR